MSYWNGNISCGALFSITLASSIFSMLQPQLMFAPLSESLAVKCKGNVKDTFGQEQVFSKKEMIIKTTKNK